MGAKKFRDSSEYSGCVQNELPPLSNFLYIEQKKNLRGAERPRFEFSATVLHRICKQRFSLVA